MKPRNLKYIRYTTHDDKEKAIVFSDKEDHIDKLIILNKKNKMKTRISYGYMKKKPHETIYMGWSDIGELVSEKDKEFFEKIMNRKKER